jgi:hypothetical protein
VHICCVAIKMSTDSPFLKARAFASYVLPDNGAGPITLEAETKQDISMIEDPLAVENSRSYK